MTQDLATADAGAFFPEHEARAAILAELHARPFLPIEAPRRVYHYAFATNHEEAQTDRAALAALSRAHQVAPPTAESRFHYFDFGAWRLRWEQHTEFTTYTWSTDRDARAPFRHGDPLRAGEIVFTPPGRLIVATHLCVVDRSEPLDSLAKLFKAESLCVVGVDRNSAHVVTDFALDSHGYTRFAIRLMNAPAIEAGRLVQRLLEIETYRTMALLGLPLAHDVSPQLRAMERELSEITQSLSIAHDSRTSQQLLRRLSDLLAKSEALSTRAAFRFGASRAYHALVRNRLALLQESPVGPHATLSSFLSVRFDPAIETCNAVETRQTRFSRDVERANDLMRTGITLEMERQNGALLEDLNRRNRLQMRLNRMVQGISIAGLAYYLVGIFSYASRGLKAAGVLGESISAEAASALGLPFALLLAWGFMARVQYLSRRAVEEEKLR